MLGDGQFNIQCIDTLRNKGCRVRVFLNDKVKELVITSGFHSVDTVHKTPHTGIDIQMNMNTPILSPVKGYVSEVFNYGSQNAGLGLKVKMENGSELIFGHMSFVSQKVGDAISVGEQLGLSGNTGCSTAPH
jgi:murein DD-endopeptidase MepM/ murein hydrolase activator NlpD